MSDFRFVSYCYDSSQPKPYRLQVAVDGTETVYYDREFQSREDFYQAIDKILPVLEGDYDEVKSEFVATANQGW